MTDLSYSQCKVGDSVYADMPRVRLDGGGRQFRRRWGYDAGSGVVHQSNNAAPVNVASGNVNGGYALEDIEEDGDDYSDTYSLREDPGGVDSVTHDQSMEGKSS